MAKSNTVPDSALSEIEEYLDILNILVKYTLKEFFDILSIFYRVKVKISFFALYVVFQEIVYLVEI